MKKLIALSVMVMVLGCVSWGWAGIYSYDVEQVNSQDMYGVFTNDSGSDASVALTLYYGENNGNIAANYYYSVDGTNWEMIVNAGDNQSWDYAGVIADGDSFWLKFMAGSDKSINAYDISDPAPYWFAFNSGDYNYGDPIGCVAIIEGSPAVPIPGAIWLLGSGLGALMVTRRKRHKA